MTTPTDVLGVARAYQVAPTVEDPPHSNETIIGQKFGWDGVPWCAEFVSVCMREAGMPFNESASCSVLVGRYQDGSNGSWLGSAPQEGAQFFLGSRGQDHTGLVEAVNSDGTVTTVEGNWGDKVARVVRPSSSFFGFGLALYAPAPAAADPSGAVADPSDPGYYWYNRKKNMMHGGDIARAQTVLINNCGQSLSDGADGWFGPQTRDAVINVQRYCQITDDGVVGPQTWGLLAYVAATHGAAL